jgi:hypothetical protein
VVGDGGGGGVPFVCPNIATFVGQCNGLILGKNFRRYFQLAGCGIILYQGIENPEF